MRIALKQGDSLQLGPDSLQSNQARVGVTKQQRVSGKGDVYLRMLLTQGARTVLNHTKDSSSWLQALTLRRPMNVVVIALANKMARTAWAVLVKNAPFDSAQWFDIEPVATSV